MSMPPAAKPKPKSKPTPRAGVSDLLPPSTAEGVERAGGLLLTARTLAEGVYQGRHRTPDRGASTEFYDYRPYVPGDPTHLVDWRLWGRTDRFYIRRFRQDSQLTVMLILDGSASMRYSGSEQGGRRKSEAGSAARPSKLRRARELAAALAYLAVRQGDRVGLIVTAHEKSEQRLVSPGAGFPALHGVVATLEAVGDSKAGARAKKSESEPAEHLPNLAAGLRLCAAAHRQRSLIVTIGDALDEPAEFFTAASRLRFGAAGGATGAQASAARGSDLVLMQVLTDEELDLAALANSGPARLLDVERHERVRADPRDVAASYNELMRAHLDAMRSGMMALGGRYALCRTSADPVEGLRALFTRRGTA
jgi:uncharacterized protein (DUF58 family)